MTTVAELQDVRKCILFARKWAYKHFRADDAARKPVTIEDLDTMSGAFYVEFPAPDYLTVCPSIFGVRGAIEIEYRLAFRVTGLYWVCQNYNLPDLQVMQVKE